MFLIKVYSFIQTFSEYLADAYCIPYFALSWRTVREARKFTRYLNSTLDFEQTKGGCIVDSFSSEILNI